jgi:hypothetical protein
MRLILTGFQIAHLFRNIVFSAQKMNQLALQFGQLEMVLMIAKQMIVMNILLKMMFI